MNNKILDDALTSEERDEFDKLKAEREVENSLLKGIITTGVFAMIILKAFFYFGFIEPQDQCVEGFVAAFWAALGFVLIAIVFLGARKNY